MLHVPDGLTARPVTRSDAGALTELIAACELHDDGSVEIAVEDIASDLQRPSLDLAAHTVGVFDGMSMVAYGEVYGSRRAEACVRPAYRGRGLGNALLRWTWDVARAGGGLLVGQTVSENCHDTVELFQAHGYAERWVSWLFEMELAGEPPAPRLPDGYALETFVPGQDEEAAYRVIEDAFNEWPDRDPSTFEDWAALAVRRPGFEPSQLALVRHRDQVVGACLTLDYGDDGGYVQQLAVAKPHRGQGLAKAMLVDAFRTSWRRGQRVCGVSTDSRTGARDLYEHVGMRRKRTYTHWAKEL